MARKSTIYKIKITNWDKYNRTLKKGHKCVLISYNFLSDAKVRTLSPVGKLLYLSCILVAGESTSSQIEVDHESLCYQSGVKSQSVQSQLDQLQSLQLLTYEKIEPLLDRIGKDRIGKERNRISADLKKPEIQGELIPSTQVNKLTDRGCIPEFMIDQVCFVRLENVTHRAQKSWLEAYPSVDFIIQEVRRAHGWIETNPKKAPKDFGKFMLNWLSRAYETYRKGLPSNRKKDGNDELRRMLEDGEL